MANETVDARHLLAQVELVTDLLAGIRQLREALAKQAELIEAQKAHIESLAKSDHGDL